MTLKKYFTIVFLLISIYLSAQENCKPPGNPGDSMGCAIPGGCPPSNPNGAPNNGGGVPIKVPVVVPRDPNEILGPTGYDTTKKWVSVKSVLPYKVYFENDPSFATAPAQKVMVYLPIHPKINPASLRLSDFGFGPFNFSVPPNTSFYTTRLDVRDSLHLFVDITAGIDIPNRRAFWIFESIDPATGLAATLPPNSGFLPINDSLTHKGEGYVMFSLQPVATALTGDTVATTASIYFDTEDSLNTNTWVNTIDAVAPTSRMDLLPGFVNADFPIRWAGRDDSLGSGVKHYAIYYAKNSGPFTLLQDAIDSTGMNFPGGDIGATYSFYSIATDNTGNREAQKTNGETIAAVQSQPNICPGSNTVFTFGSSATGYTYQWQVDTGSGFTNISNGGVYGGATTNALQLINPPTSWYGYQFRAIATNGSNTIEGATQTLKFSNTWFGTASTAWENPTNWSCGVLPDEHTDVIINSKVPNATRLSSNGVCRSLTLSNGAIFTVSAGYNLDVKGK